MVLEFEDVDKSMKDRDSVMNFNNYVTIRDIPKMTPEVAKEHNKLTTLQSQFDILSDNNQSYLFIQAQPSASNQSRK